MHINTFCNALQIVTLMGYYVNYKTICEAYPENLEIFKNYFVDDKTILSLINKNYCSFGQDFYFENFIKNIIKKYSYYKLTAEKSEKIDVFQTSHFELFCFDYLNIKNKIINEISFSSFTKFSYLTTKILNLNKVKKLCVYSGRLGHRFELYDLNVFLLSLNTNFDIESFVFSDMVNLDIDILLSKMPNLKSLSLCSSLVYIKNELTQIEITPISNVQLYKNMLSLNLQNFCDKLTNKELFKMMGMFPNLTSLHLRYSEIKDDSLIKLFDTSKNITQLNFDTCNCLSVNVLQLIPIMYPQIENFFVCNMIQITDDYIINFIKQCKQLNKMDIRMFAINKSNLKCSENLIACVYKYFNINQIPCHYTNIIKQLDDTTYQTFLNQIN